MTIVRYTARSKARRAAGPPVAAAHLPADVELHRIAERVLKYSDADETEVDIAVNADALTRFANNTIHQNVAELSLTVSVRTVFGGRTARATTNKTDEESLRRVVATSGTLARSQPKDPNLLPLPARQKYAKVARFDAATAGATPADRARAVERVAKLAAAQPNCRRHFHHRRFGLAAGELARIGRVVSPDARRILRHDARSGFLRLGQSKFPCARQCRSAIARRARQRQSDSVAPTARTRTRSVDRDTRACGRPRSCGFLVLRLRRHRRA